MKSQRHSSKSVDPYQAFRYIVVPCAACDLVQDGILTRGQAWLYGVITAYGPADDIHLDNETLAKKCGISVNSLLKDMKALEKLGLIKMAPRKRK